MGIYRRKDSRFWWLLLERPKGTKAVREATRIPAKESTRELAERQYTSRMSDLSKGRLTKAVISSGQRLRLSDRWTYVYFIKAGNHVKIGRALDIQRRLIALQIGHPERMELLAVAPGHLGLEREIHRFFKRTATSGEWFSATPQLLAFIGRVKCGEHPAAIMAAAAITE